MKKILFPLLLFTIWLCFINISTNSLFTNRNPSHARDIGDENRRRYCHGWKKAVNYSRDTSCEQNNHLVFLPDIHGNPYHAFHDTAWAVGYYLYYCLQDPEITHLWINSKKIHSVNIQHCSNDVKSPELISGMRPSWGICFLSILAIKYGIQQQNIHVNDFSASNWPPGFCWRKKTAFTGYYREFKYLTLPSKAENTFWRFLNKHGLYKNRNFDPSDSAPVDMKKDVLINMTDTISNYYAGDIVHRSDVGEKKKLQVLLYGRGDVNRRRWGNIDETINYLRKDESIEITTIYNMPSTLSMQVRLFHNADIVITPHGAALANSVFMRKNSAILEIHKCCLSEIRTRPTELRMWTGWHVKEFSLNIRYLQCHQANNILSIDELKALELAPEEDHGCREKEFDVDPEEVLENLQLIRKEMQKIKGNKMKVDWNVFMFIGFWIAIILLGYRLYRSFLKSQ